MPNNNGIAIPTRAPTQITYRIVKDLTPDHADKVGQPGRLV